MKEIFSSYNSLPITNDSELLKAFPAIKEKFVVDFSNGIDVVNDLLRVQNQSQSFFNRMVDGFTGKSRRRQDQINNNLKCGIEASLNWLVELTEEIAESNIAIAKVNNRINELKFDIASLVNFSVSVRNELEHVSNYLNDRCDNIQYQLDEIKSLQSALLHLDFVFDKLKTSVLWRPLSVTQRLYLGLEELRWGDFGSYVYHYPTQAVKLLPVLEQKSMLFLTNCMKFDDEFDVDRRIELEQFLNGSINVSSDLIEALNYLGDWADNKTAPYVRCIIDSGLSCSTEVTLLPSARRLTVHLVSEVFRG